MSEAHRKIAREIAQDHLLRGDHLGWFEAVYTEAAGDASVIPWADLAPNPLLTDWLDAQPVVLPGARALKVGCGLGDDAEELKRRGYQTTAFDISPTAICWCRKRFPKSSVAYAVQDLFSAPPDWRGAFDFVLESYTLQVLPPEPRRLAAKRIASFLKPNGTLLVLCRGREPDDPPGNMPWPLTREEVDSFRAEGLNQKSFEDLFDEEDPPVRRFRAVFAKQVAA